MNPYLAVVDKVLGIAMPEDRRRTLLTRSDVVLGALEELNLRAYRARVPSGQIGSAEASIPLPRKLKRAILDLVIEVGLSKPKKLQTVADGLSVAFDVQSVILGVPHDLAVGAASF